MFYFSNPYEFRIKLNWRRFLEESRLLYKKLTPSTVKICEHYSIFVQILNANVIQKYLTRVLKLLRPFADNVFNFWRFHRLVFSWPKLGQKIMKSICHLTTFYLGYQKRTVLEKKRYNFDEEKCENFRKKKIAKWLMFQKKTLYFSNVWKFSKLWRISKS